MDPKERLYFVRVLAQHGIDFLDRKKPDAAAVALATAGAYAFYVETQLADTVREWVDTLIGEASDPTQYAQGEGQPR